MFRMTFMTAMMLLLSNTLSAADQIGKAPEAQSTYANPERAGQVTDEYVDSQLDWRSYYLNRIDRAVTRDSQKPVQHVDG